MTDTGLSLRVFVRLDLDRELSETQRECCELAARAAVACNGADYYEGLDIAALAEAMARGLFGPGYEAADRTQRLIWCDMCEDAMREALEAA